MNEIRRLATYIRSYEQYGINAIDALAEGIEEFSTEYGDDELCELKSLNDFLEDTI